MENKFIEFVKSQKLDINDSMAMTNYMYDVIGIDHKKELTDKEKEKIENYISENISSSIITKDINDSDKKKKIRFSK